MGEINLFRIGGDEATELPSAPVAFEKDLQALMEQRLQVVLGVRFLASEFKVTDGRIDTLGLDEEGSPVVIEYKRHQNESVINQGLFYLDWVMGHRGDFEKKVSQVLGPAVAGTVDWTNPRLICIASEFSKFDIPTANQSNRNILLCRYKFFKEDHLLMLEEVGAQSAKRPAGPTVKAVMPGTASATKVMADFEKASAAVRGWHADLEAFILSLGADVHRKLLERYVAFTRGATFAALRVRPQSGKILLNLRIDPTTVDLVSGFTRDVTGKYWIGRLEVTIDSAEDVKAAFALVRTGYEHALTEKA